MQDLVFCRYRACCHARLEATLPCELQRVLLAGITGKHACKSERQQLNLLFHKGRAETQITAAPLLAPFDERLFLTT